MSRLVSFAFFGVYSCFLFATPLKADVTVLFESKQQFGSNPEVGATTRAIYLGRLFGGQSVNSGVSSFTSIESFVTVRNALNVKLWAGNGNSLFEINNANFVDTGARFTQPTGNPTSVWADGSGMGTLPILVDPLVGQQMMTSFRGTGHLDFWLVGDRLDTFSAPSGSNPGGGNSIPFQFYVGLSAVPEPSSLLLCGLGLSGFYAWRRRRNNILKIAN